MIATRPGATQYQGEEWTGKAEWAAAVARNAAKKTAARDWVLSGVWASRRRRISVPRVVAAVARSLLPSGSSSASWEGGVRPSWWWSGRRKWEERSGARANQ